MNANERNYILIIVAHILIGFSVYLVEPLAKVYGYSMILLGLFWIFKNRNANHEALYISAYIVGSEVFLRMTQGNPVYEFSKYGVIFFLIMGMYYRGFSKNAIPYWLFLLFLVPGILMASYNLNYDTRIAKTLSFNISGPLCLGISSFYTYRRRFTMTELNNVLLFAGLPTITCATYLIFYTPDIQATVTGTGSNFEMSGGFGPNQVSTILGFGMFVFFARTFFSSPSKLLLLVNFTVALVIGYRGLITFSRGGMITAIGMLLILIVATYFKVNRGGRRKFGLVLAILIGAIIATFTYSSFQTSGLIEKRYANQDAAGRAKQSYFTGREGISATEIEYFLRNPVFGIGAGKGAELRMNETGRDVLSHNELTRMLGEHGIFGVFCLLILFITPFVLYLDNRDHLYLSCFVVFWLLTINHAAMRTAAPAFIYSLALLKISIAEKNPLHRQPTVG